MFPFPITLLSTLPLNQEKVGALLYIAKDLNYKVRNDLKVYKAKELESIFIEVINKKSKNYIIGCVYKHPKMSVKEFTDSFFQPLLDKISFENKKVLFMGDFNINLLNYDSHTDTTDVIDTMYSNHFLPT